MKTIHKTFFTLSLSAAVVALSGCSAIEGVLPDRSVAYKQSRAEAPLEIPPDLSSANIHSSMVIPAERGVPVDGSASLSDYQNKQVRFAAGGVGVLANQKDIEVLRDGDTRWLLINAPVEEVWSKMRDFWVEEGWLITKEDPQVGILETDWAENRADIPGGVIRGFLGGVLDSLYSSSTRDKFRVRLERGEDDATTELFISHRGVEEVAVAGQDDRFLWVGRPSDPELEAEMLRLMMIYMGADAEQAGTKLAKAKPSAPKAKKITSKSGKSALSVNAPISRAWRLTGLALDRVGFTVEDRDRNKGIYYVRYDDPVADQETKKGFFSKLAFWSDDDAVKEVEYQILVEGTGSTSRVVVLDKAGAVGDSKTAERILDLLFEQLK